MQLLLPRRAAVAPCSHRRPPHWLERAVTHAHACGTTRSTSQSVGRVPYSEDDRRNWATSALCVSYRGQHLRRWFRQRAVRDPEARLPRHVSMVRVCNCRERPPAAPYLSREVSIPNVSAPCRTGSPRHQVHVRLPTNVETSTHTCVCTLYGVVWVWVAAGHAADRCSLATPGVYWFEIVNKPYHFHPPNDA
jgi:hypothetical protein